jgi:hypothetical protein
MRETCARVLAAALMTAAIATVVGMSTLFGTAREASRPIAAPPSSLQRIVRLTAHVQPTRRPSRPRVTRVVTSRTIHAQPRRLRASVTRLAAVHKRRIRRAAPARQLAAAPATTATTTVTTTVPPAVVSASPAPTADAQPVVDADGPGRHGQGHAYGHDKKDD